jgi:hypothetical protein
VKKTKPAKENTEAQEEFAEVADMNWCGWTWARQSAKRVKVFLKLIMPSELVN